MTVQGVCGVSRRVDSAKAVERVLFGAAMTFRKIHECPVACSTRSAR